MAALLLPCVATLLLPCVAALLLPDVAALLLPDVGVWRYTETGQAQKLDGQKNRADT
ncbi:hypothetical protein [Desulfomicrobium baculatum]|uniref:hypothetical protein n=1 Tax=Desulfomicrobium baculatum TaxID=899 RepID=UPI00019E217C|nr:hypothetical protein [Desulfomicrobium baculatum]